MNTAYALAESFGQPVLPTLLSLEDRVDFLRLARTENVGPISFFHLIKQFGSAGEALRRLPTLRTKKSPLQPPSVDTIRREMDAHYRQGAQLILYSDAAYPAILRTLKDPPLTLSLQGRMELLQRPLFAVVGSRNASQAGEKIATRITGDLSAQGWTIVSGLAKGIDTFAHKAALTRGTIAVTAGGMGQIYPAENARLYAEIAEKGIILSEDPMGQPLHAGLFPKRNRVISGLSKGILIIEAGLRSGSMLTAQYAGEQGRDVFAVPGHPLDPRSRGVNLLLKQGATLVETAEDIFQDYAALRSLPFSSPPRSPSTVEPLRPSHDTPETAELYQALQEAITSAPTSIEDLSLYLNVPPFQVRTLLVEMELNGEIQHYPGDAVMRVSELSSLSSESVS